MVFEVFFNSDRSKQTSVRFSKLCSLQKHGCQEVDLLLWCSSVASVIPKISDVSESFHIVCTCFLTVKNGVFIPASGLGTSLGLSLLA